MSKRLLALVLALLMLTTLVSACGNQPNAKPSESATPSATTGENTAEATPDATAGTDIPKEVVKLKILNYGDTTPRRTEFLEKDLHDKVLKDLNIDLTVDFAPWDNSKPTLMFASGEDFATFSWMLNFSDAVAKGFYAEIPQASIDKYLPDLVKNRQPYGFDTDNVQLGGKIYGIPFGNKPYSGGFQSIMMRQDLLDEVGINDITTLDQLENAMKLVKEKHPDVGVVTELFAQRHYLREVINPDQLITYHTDYFYVDEMAKDDKVYSFYESDAFKNLAAIQRRWVDLGYITNSDLANKSQGLADWKAGKQLSYIGVPARPMEELPGLQKVVPNVKLNLYKLGSMPKIYSGTSNTVYAISSASKNVDRYLMLFNWMFKNQENYDLLAYGVKDKDYTLEGDKVKKLVNDSFWDEWQIFNVTFGRYSTDVPDDFIASYKTYDQGAIKAKGSGFAFDSSSLKAEIAQLDAIRMEKMEPIEYGLVDYDKNFPAAIKAMKDAGLDKYLAEYQRQFSEWYAAQPK